MNTALVGFCVLASFSWLTASLAADGRSALLAAVESQQWSVARALLDLGADPSLGDELGRTPLMEAIRQGQDEFAMELLDRGALPTSTDASGHTALHHALIQGSRPMVSRLREMTPLNHQPCCQDHDLLTHALATGDWLLIESLLERMPPSPQWQNATLGWLMDAIRLRDENRLRLLLAKHLVPPAPEGHKQPLLAYAMVTNHREVFELLLRCGADPNTQLNTPAEKSFCDLLPNSTVKEYVAKEPGMNVLMLAAGLARPSDLKLLLEKGARRNIATRSKYKLVPLIFAAWSRNPECQQLLLDSAPTPQELRLEISLSGQRASLYKNGRPVFQTPISTGRPGFPTPAGAFVITDKQARHVSTIYKVPMPFFMRLSCLDFGMHEGDTSSSFASHGCIRLPPDAARKLYREVPLGTLVTISP